MGFASESQQAQSGVCWAVVSFQGLTGEGFTSELKCFQHGHWQSLDLCGHNPEASISHRLSAGGCPQFLVTQASAEPARDSLLARWQSPSYITYRCEGSLVVFYWLQLSQRIDAFQLWCWRRLLKVPGTARRSNWSVLRETNPEDLLEGLMLKLKLQYFGHLM